VTQALLRQHPQSTGVSIGVNDWMLSVEIALPAEGAALYDVARYDVDTYSELSWLPLEDRVRGINWQRGSDDPADGRPVTGIAELQLDNRDRAWSPWSRDSLATYRGPGTLMRWGIRTMLSWIPQYSGLVETWVEETEGLGAENLVSVTLIETIGRLGTLDGHQVSPAVGAGETSGQRAVRLLDEAAWNLGFYDEAQSSITLQATTMAANRLAELHLTAESVDAWFRAHRSGLAMLEPQDPADHPAYNFPEAARYDLDRYDVGLYGGVNEDDYSTMRHASYYYSEIVLSPWAADESAPDETGRTRLTLVYDADSLVSLNDLDAVVNDVRLTRVGGAIQVAVDEFSIGRRGHRSLARTNLVTQLDADVLTIAEATVARRSERVLRVESVDLWNRPGNRFGQAVLDVGDLVKVIMPDNQLAVRGHVTSLEHSITPQSVDEVVWTTTIGLQTYPGFVDRDDVTITAAATVTVTDVL
jgi:hypothetical protein